MRLPGCPPYFVPPHPHHTTHPLQVTPDCATQFRERMLGDTRFGDEAKEFFADCDKQVRPACPPLLRGDLLRVQVPGVPQASANCVGCD